MSDPVVILYRFEWPDGRKLEYPVKLDPDTFLMRAREEGEFPDWSRRDRVACPGCTLPASVEGCPVALNLLDFVNTFHGSRSIEKVRVTVGVPDRTYGAEVPLQKGMQALFGLIMATSGCPKLDCLRPMARFHLPFAETEETILRAVSFYLLSQYFLSQTEGGTPDWKLEGLQQQYEQISLVNAAIARSIREAQSGSAIPGVKSGDALLNAITILDAFAQMATLEISMQLLGLRRIFLPEPKDSEAR